MSATRTKENRVLFNILNDPPRSFEKFPTLSIYFEAWKVHKGIRIEGLLLTCEGTDKCRPWPDKCYHGARYKQPFSPDFPHFEVGNNNKFHDQDLSHLEAVPFNQAKPSEFAIINKISSHSIYGQTSLRLQSSQSRRSNDGLFTDNLSFTSAKVMCVDHENYVICKATRGNKKLELSHVFQ